MTDFRLTSSQQDAVGAFEKWLGSRDQVFLLKGAAGTGKTTLVTEFIKILKDKRREAVLMAPTGRAAHILSSKTMHAASTIHRGIYSISELKHYGSDREDTDDGSMQTRFALRTNQHSPDTVYIVDESSMVSDNNSENEAFAFGSGLLMSDLFTFAGGRKIVFVGDYAQLPPVGMNFSPALDKGYIESKFHCKVYELILREVMRQQDGSVMLENASRIRDNIESRTFIEFKLNDGVDSTSENDNLLKPYFHLAPKKPSARCAVIAYSNQQALLYNLAIRRQYFGETAPRLKPGDLLMVARNNYAYDAELFNGNIVQVESCVSDREVERRTVRVRLAKGQTETVELHFRKTTIRFMANARAVSVNVLILDNFLDDPDGAPGGILSRALIVDFEHRLPGNIKRGTDQYLSLLHQDPYYNALVCKYGYAMTCHKAQGGEWDNVFVDMSRMGGTANEDYFRWAYTALTRASGHLWHYRAPDFNYISNLVVEPIQLSSNIKISQYSEEGDFKAERMKRISRLCTEAGITVREDNSISYQHRLSFSASPDHHAHITLWHTDKGYSGKTSVISSSSEDFLERCRIILDSSFAAREIPFRAPERPFAEKLVDYMKSLFSELDITLLDITQDNYEDTFHLKTDGLAKVCLHYTAKGNYTYMKMLSSMGSGDTRLEALRHKFL